MLGIGRMCSSHAGRYVAHTKEIEEGPPPVKQIELAGITIHRIEGGKIVEEYVGDRVGYAHDPVCLCGRMNTGFRE